jgi:hypothetical protein
MQLRKNYLYLQVRELKKTLIDIPNYINNNDIYICNNGMKKFLLILPKILIKL